MSHKARLVGVELYFEDLAAARRLAGKSQVTIEAIAELIREAQWVLDQGRLKNAWHYFGGLSSSGLARLRSRIYHKPTIRMRANAPQYTIGFARLRFSQFIGQSFLSAGLRWH